MKQKNTILFVSLFAVCSASASSMYHKGTEAVKSAPLKWSVGADVIYDDNVIPGSSDSQSAFSINPYVGATFSASTGQTTMEVYGRVGVTYYLDAASYTPYGSSKSVEMDDLSPQIRGGANFAHQVNERLRLISSNTLAYELEPDYSYGFASSRANDEYLYWNTDNAVGYRWTERLGTYTGFNIGGLTYKENEISDRVNYGLYNQFRYMVNPQTVLTGEYRYGRSTAPNAVGADVDDHYILGGVEYSFNSTSVFIGKVGAQFRSPEVGESTSSPFVEAAVNTRLSQQFSVRSFLRYGLESYDTIQYINPLTSAYFSDHSVLRFGVDGNYQFSEFLSAFGGVNYITSKYDNGRGYNLFTGPTATAAGGYSEDLINYTLGLGMKFSESLSGSVSYNHTTSTSDFISRDYDRNRISVGVRADF